MKGLSHGLDMPSLKRKKIQLIKILIAAVTIFFLTLLFWYIPEQSSSERIDLNAYPLKRPKDILPTKSIEEIQYEIAKRGSRNRTEVEDPGVLPKNAYGNMSIFIDEPRKIKESRDFGFAEREQDTYTAIPLIPGENVISMTLYGSDLRYTMGAIKNAELAQRNFPGWKLRIYTETPSEHPRYGIVPQTVLFQLRKLGADLHFIDPGEDHVAPMMWRFLVGDDEWVDRFIVRDADARLIERDAQAVYAWFKSGAPFHSIRDHPSHAAYAISGGLWGAVTKDVKALLRRSWRELLYRKGENYFDDMSFLNAVVWPRVQHVAYCSDSVSCLIYPNSYPFPVQRYGYECVGAVYNEHDLARPIDVHILRQAGENQDCLPNPNFKLLNTTVQESSHKALHKEGALNMSLRQGALA